MVHAITDGETEALCGTKPGRLSAGWARAINDRGVVQPITCEKCIRKADLNFIFLEKNLGS